MATLLARFSGWSPSAEVLSRVSFWEAIGWLVFIPIALYLGWSNILSLTFALSSYANARTAFSGHQAARAEIEARNTPACLECEARKAA